MPIRRFELISLFALVVAVLALVVGLRPGSFASAAGSASPNGPTTAGVIPSTFNYQGTLRLADGSLANNAYNITIKIYDAAVGGNELHSESFNNVAVRDGLFKVVLGDSVAIGPTVFTDAPRFVGIMVAPDPEMVPRQRLHPVPWAQQATTAVNANTATTLVPNASVSGLTVIGTLYVTGPLVGPGNTVGSRTIRLSDNLTVDNNLSVGGELTARARRDIGSQTAPVQITRSDYDVSIRRYVVEAPDGGTTPNSTPVDDALLQQLCGDEDGCTITLGMRDWGGYKPGLLATVGPFRFSMSAIVDGKRDWDARLQNGVNFVTGTDGDGVVGHAGIAFDCYFTDTKHLSGQPTDNVLGFELLNWYGVGFYDSPNMVCVLIIDD